MPSTKKKSSEAKELTAAALMVLAQRLEAKVTKLTRALDSLKKKARSALGMKKSSS